MKKLLSACAVAAAFVSAPAMAQGYFGLGLGSSSISGYDETVAGVTYSGGNAAKTSFKILGGYQFNPTWGVEGQYAALGKRAIKETPTFVGVIDSVDYSQLGIYGTGTLPINANFSLFGKLGLSANKSKGTDTAGGSASENNTNLSFGLGASYKFMPNLAARAEYENFGKVIKAVNGFSEVKASNFSVSLLYSF